MIIAILRTTPIFASGIIADRRLPRNADFLLTHRTLPLLVGFLLAGCSTGEDPLNRNLLCSVATESKCPRVILSQTSLDLGQGTTGQELSGSIIVENGGQQPLRIENVELGCGCSSFELNKRVLAFGESAKLEVTVLLRGERKVTFPVRIFTIDPVLPLVIREVTAEVQPSFLLADPPVLDFGELLEGTSWTRPISLKKRDGGNWAGAQEVKGVSANNHLRIRKEEEGPSSARPDQIFTVTIDTDLGIGFFEDAITFWVPEIGRRLQVPVRALIVPKIEVRPNVLWFNNVNRKSGSLERKVLVRRNDGKPLGDVIKTAAIAGLRISDPAHSMLNPNVLQLTVTLDPVAAQGVEGGRLTLWLRNERKPLNVGIMINRTEGMR